MADNKQDNGRTSNQNSFLDNLNNLSSRLASKKINILKLLGVIYGVLLILGAFIFVIYFFDINYMPNLSWESSVSLLFTAAIVSMSLIITISIVLVSPGIVWLEIIMRDQYIKSVLSEGGLKPKGFFRLNFSVILLLLASYFFTSVTYNNSIEGEYKILYTGIGLLCFWLAIYFPYSIVRSSRIALTLSKYKGIIYKQGIKYESITKSQEYIYHSDKVNLHKNIRFSLKKILLKLYPLKLLLPAFYPSLILIIIPAFSMSFTIKDKIQVLRNESQILSIFIFMYLLAFFVNKAITIVCFNKKALAKYIEAFIIGFSVFFLMSVIFSSFATIPKIVMSQFGWGNISKFTIIVNNEGCSILEAMDIDLDEKCSNKINTYKVKDIDILLSIGENFVIRKHLNAKAKESNKMLPVHDIILPKRLVISWARSR